MTNAPSPPRFSWREVLQQVAAWGILAAVSGVAYISYTVPSSLDQIKAGQKANAERAAERDALMDRRVTTLETNVDGIDARVTRIEAQK